MQLTDEHINYIVKDISYRGIVDDELGDELVDHICSLVENRMEEGQRFIDAYDEVLISFGKEEIQNIQTQSIELVNNNKKIMLRNYFKIALRNLSKHRFYSFINITGLAVSVACCLLISLFVLDELSYDQSYKDSDQIYRTNRHGKYGENEFHFATAPAPLGPSLAAEIPEIEHVTRFRTRGSYLIKTPEMTESYKESTLIFADTSVFSVFGIELINGNRDNIIKAKNTLAISQSMANKYFPNQDAVGKTLILDGNTEYHVDAVFEDLPENSHLDLDFILSMEGIQESKSTLWLSNNFYTYFKVTPGTNPKELEEKINKMADNYVAPQIEDYGVGTFEEFKEVGNYMYFELQPLKEVYLHSNFVFDIGATGDITYVYLFTTVALFILVIACINFMNLSTARSANRAKEVGVRKVLGSFRSHLIRQFLLESLLLSLAAFIIGLGIASISLPFFNQLSGKSLALPFGNLSFVIAYIFSAAIVGALAGVYPAFFLSAFKPVQVLKGKVALGTKSGLIRSALVVFQFFISIVLLIGTATIYQQLQFIQNKKLGYNKEQVVIINDAYMLGEKSKAFVDELKQLADVKQVTSTGFIPIDGYYRSDNTYWEDGKEPTEDNLVNMQSWGVDENYIETMGMELVWGRNFEKDRASDSSAVILNETAFRAYNLSKDKENWIQTFHYNYETGNVEMDKYDKYRVIGVIKDFHFQSMKQPIGNLALRLDPNNGIMSVRLNTSDYNASLDRLNENWKKFAPEIPFNYEFMDSAFGNMYEEEQRLAEVLTIFAGLAIFIGCLGLFALAAFMAEQRIKEIGIRKVLGASVNGLVMMLSKDFSKLILFAFILAVPVSWWGMNQWLKDYSYKISVGWEVYVIAGMIAFAIAWLTVAYQSIRAAISNPVESLRSE